MYTVGATTTPQLEHYLALAIKATGGYATPRARIDSIACPVVLRHAYTWREERNLSSSALFLL